MLTATLNKHLTVLNYLLLMVTWTETLLTQKHELLLVHMLNNFKREILPHFIHIIKGEVNMIRARFFQDTYLLDDNIVRRKNQEHDITLDIALELFKADKIDVLNPFLNEDLFENIDIYEDDWIEFCSITKREGV